MIGDQLRHVSVLPRPTNALSDITCKMKWKWHPKFSENSQFPSEIQWYKNTRSGFQFWNVQCSTKRSPHPPTIRISVGGIYFCDITNTGKQLCRPNEPFVVVLENIYFLNKISPFWVDFEICNFVDLFMSKHTNYTLTKIQKVKKHNRTPLKITKCLSMQDNFFPFWIMFIFKIFFLSFFLAKAQFCDILRIK